MTRHHHKPPTVAAVREELTVDERETRPGPTPPRVRADLTWKHLAKLVVQSSVRPSPDEASGLLGAGG
ncbi:MAG: hypothetical protein PVH96_10090 [Gemmatimonadota bacterium]|jgi:hypothetical protein